MNDLETRSLREAVMVSTDAIARQEWIDSGDPVEYFDKSIAETRRILGLLGSLADIKLLPHQQRIALEAVAKLSAVINELKTMQTADELLGGACFGDSCSVDGGGC